MKLISMTTYNPVNGEITGTIKGDEFSVLMNKTAYCLNGSYSPQTHYVKNGEATERPRQSSMLRGMTLQNLPIPCKIYINGTEYDCEDGIAELSFNQPISYHIQVVAFPFLDWEVTFENQTQ